MSFFKKSGLLGILIIVATVSILGSFTFPAPAKATIPVVVETDVVATTFKVKDEILEGLKVAVQAAASTVVSYVLRKVAYDSAVWLASGGKGQNPFAQTKSFGDYLKNVGNDALGHGIEELSKGAGFNLCSIPDPKVDLAMKVGLRVNLTPTNDPTSKPSCTFTDFQKNWSADAWRSKFSTVGSSIEQQFNTAFQVDQTGLGIQLAATTKLSEKANSAVSAANSERIANQGFVDKTTQISGDIETPAAVIGEEFKATGNSKQIDKSGDQITQAINSGNYKNLPGALSNFFLSTLAGTVLKNFQQKGILPFGLCIGGAGGESCASTNTSVSNYADSGIAGGRRAAEQLFSGFLAVHTSTVNEYDLAGQLSNCPDSPGIYNCRADSGLIQASQEVGNGNPTTIQEAISKGWLHGEFKLIPPSRAEDNTDKNCYLHAYCYSNVKVLREASVLPLGFELAAAASDPDQPWTLSQVVKGFNDCNYIKDQQGNVVGVQYDPITKPFCHLIDPDWVIKIPAARCNALGYTTSLLSGDAPDRIQDCADVSTCVAYNSDGTCASYGYCARQKNAWKFNADSCDAQFRTCRSFVDSNGAQRAYVYRSLDTSACTKDTVGCSAYSLSQDASGNWQDVAGPNAAAGYLNNGLYLNSKVSTACSANSAGCSAFTVTTNATTNQKVYLKKAPEYLGCYDSDPSTPKVDWAATTADLARITPKAACSQYAGACIPDEVSCNWYTPAQGGGGRIPGKFKAAEVVDNQIVWNDQCDAKCVGYASYREMPSTYSLGQDVAYIIPSSGAVCSAQEEGCSSFTNLSTTAGQVENVEYFSYLRACVPPNQGAQKNFITYEGSTVGGYQLKVFTLVPDENGGPKYFYRTDSDAANYNQICNETAYKAGTADADCRQFNDDAGNVYYRLLAKTIPVSNSCTPYRLNNSELLATSYDQTTCSAKKGFWNNGTCQVCLQGGEYKNGSCFYYGLPSGVQNTAGVSRSCSAAANSCRAYKGNAGNNIREVFNDTFEGGSAGIAAWKPASVALSTESTRVGEHSLGYVGATAVTRDITVTPSKSYDLTFWAKGDVQSLTASLVSTEGNYSKDFGSVGVGDTWNYYHLGPIEYGGSGTAAQLAFKNQGNNKIYLDNVRLVEVTGYIYRVKNSLKVDAVCDSNLNDNLPGEALGCMEYKDPSNKTFDLTGFSYLCREGAIGCTALYDTQNTPSDAGPKAYNVWLAGTGGTQAKIILGSDTITCQIPVGQQGCYTTITGHTAAEIIQVVGAGAFVKSTVYIPPDTPSSAPIYLVANQAASCNVADLGCTLAGVQKSTPTGLKYSTTLIKNDPATYDTAMCQQQAVGCMAFGSAGGDAFFKDPLITGQKICTYQTDVNVKGVKSSGWFWKDVGVCSNNGNTFCSANADCGAGATCQSIGAQPCYPTYLQQGNNYGLWSYGDGTKYQNFVGECPVAQDQCTEFVDHNDNDQAYYFLKNEKISSGNCDGSVSEKKGCALFDETANPNKYWSSAASYAASSKAQDALVKPVNGTNANPADANIVIKVDPDRVCGEWLQCRSSHRVWDDKEARWKVVCDDIGRCDRAAMTPEENNITNCAEWVEGTADNSGQVLTPELYVQRDTSWSGMDYTGWSIPGIFPVEELSQVNVSSVSSNPQFRLAHRIACGNQNCVDPNVPTDESCKVNNQACGAGGSGLCLNGFCLQGPDGTTAGLAGNTTAISCRTYPEKDSPFPNTAAIGKASSRFGGANLCNETKGFTTDSTAAAACECTYNKVTYGDQALIKYWSYQKPNSTDSTAVPGSTGIPNGICQGGFNDGHACDNDAGCQMDGKAAGTCLKKKRSDQLIGWQGFCLENDLSRTLNADQNQHPCLSWFPVDTIIGSQDINEQHPEAGYQAPADLGGDTGKFYCVGGNVSGGPVDPNMNFDKNYPESRNYRKFSTDLSFGTANSGNKALYGEKNFYCENQFAHGPSGTFSRDHINPGTANTIHKEDIEKIIFQVNSMPETGDAPPVGTVFELWPNDPTTGAPQASYVTKDHTKAPGVAVTGKYLGHNNDFIFMYASTKDEDNKLGTYLDKDGNVCVGDNGKVNDTCVNAGDESSGNCSSLRGNIITGPLMSRTNLGNRFNAGKARDQVTSVPATMNSEGIWDTNFSNRAICDSHAGNGGTWHAIRVKFNTDGTFAGYDVAYCQNQSYFNDQFITYKVTFQLREWCSNIADTTVTYVDDPARAIAWTNRLWKGSGYKISSGYSGDFGLVGLGFGYDIPMTPFGSIESAQPPSSSVVALTPFAAKENNAKCASGGFTSCSYTNSVVNGDPATPKFTPGAPYSCIGDSADCVRSDANGKLYSVPGALRTLVSAEGALNSLFARIPTVYNYSYQNGVYTAQSQGSSLDITANGDWQQKPRAPLVFPVGSCDSQGRCLEDNSRPGVTVGGVAKGKDALFYTSSAKVNLQFFVNVNADQMPVRQVNVFWGDGARAPMADVNQIGRNYRGYEQTTCQKVSDAVSHCVANDLIDRSCSSDTDCRSNPGGIAGATCLLPNDPTNPVGRCVAPRDTGTVCKVNADCGVVPICTEESAAPSFGRIIDKTCISNYRLFDHVYFCSRSSDNFKEAAQCPNGFPNGCCIFVPRVQVKDNWGWCNGTCKSTPGGGCYDDPNGIDQCFNQSTTNASTPFANRVILAAPAAK